MENDVLYVKRNGADGSFSYPIYFKDSFEELAAAIEAVDLADRHVCVVTDSHVGPLYLEQVMDCLKTVSRKVTFFQFDAGEENKNLDTVQKLYVHLIESGMDRKGYLAALGGGVVGDLTGFTAATYLRGIDFIQIPTTLLSQVDSSVGGKTGVDFSQYKNMVGAFHQPRLVYMNVNTLKTLSPTQFACGMGEVLKTGLICDGDFYRMLCRHSREIKALDPSYVKQIVRRCCEIKAGVVERDPKEQGERALLNLGHTIGHAVEKLKNFELLHGQCVGAGMIAAAAISRNRGMLTTEEFEMICEGNRMYDLPLTVEGLDTEDVLLATRKDKKMENGQIKFVLMNGLGHSLVDRTVTDQELCAGIGEILE